MDNKVFYLHLGYPKTATSFIKKQVLISERYHYLGKSKKNHNFFDELFNILLYVKQDDLFLKKLRELNIKKKFQYLLEISSSKNLFYSNENFLIYYGKVDIIKKIKRLKLIIDELNYYNIKILITIRNPIDLLLSYMAQNVISFKHLEKINLENIKNENSIKSYLNFNELKSILNKTFLSENIIFLDFNYLLKNNILNFEKKILHSNFVNTSLKFKTRNFRIYFCRFKFSDIFKKYRKNKNIKSLYKKIIFNLKNIILFFNNKDLEMLNNLFLNKKNFKDLDKINLSKNKEYL